MLNKDKKMGRKKIFNFALMLSVFIFGIALISSAPTLVSPASSGVISGATYKLNVTNGTMNEIINCTFYAKSASTANSSYVNISTLATNESASDFDINITFDSRILQDASDYMVYATCANATLIQNTSVTSGVIVDNTIPQAPSLSPSSNDASPQTSAVYQTFSGTVTDANTTACTYVIARGGATSGNDYIAGTGTYSTSTCSFTKAFNSTVDNGDWIWYLTASDGRNTTQSSSNHFVVSLPGSGSGGTDTSGSSSSGSGSGNHAWIIGIIVLVVIIIVAIGLSKKN